MFLQLLALFRDTTLWQVWDKRVTVLVLGTAVFSLCTSVHSLGAAYRVLQSVGTGVCVCCLWLREVAEARPSRYLCNVQSFFQMNPSVKSVLIHVRVLER